MTDLMQTLLDYVWEHRIKEFLPLEHDHFCGAHLCDLEEAFLNTLDDSQKKLWDQWYEAQRDYDGVCERALFQAALQIARELR